MSGLTFVFLLQEYEVVMILHIESYILHLYLTCVCSRKDASIYNDMTSTARNTSNYNKLTSPTRKKLKCLLIYEYCISIA